MASEIRVNQIQNRSGLGTVTFTDTGAVLSGIVTVTGNLKGPSEVDATTVTATTVKVGTAVTISAGVVTATSFSGDGSGLSGIDASSLKSGGVVKVQANSSGAVVTGVATATQITVGDSFVKQGAVGLGTTTSSGRDAGISTSPGTIIFIPDVGLQVYAGETRGWRIVANTDNNLEPGLQATGGVINDYTDGANSYRAHIFNSSGTFDVTALSTNPGLPDNVEYVVVGGGGGGGAYGASGAGGYRSSVSGESSGGGNSAETVITATVQSYPVVVGGGGAGSNTNGNTGSPSSFGPISSLGGGSGMNYNQTGGAGGSGGAAGDYPRGGRPGPATNYPGPLAQGFPGGLGLSDQSSYTEGGGGGGAGAAGGSGPPSSVPSGNAPTIDTNGGNGVRTLIGGPDPGTVGTPGPSSSGGRGGSPSTDVTGGWLAGGGGGGMPGYLLGGAGGGGNSSAPTGGSGTANTGGGAGGGKAGTGGNGGSGIVIVRYRKVPS